MKRPGRLQRALGGLTVTLVLGLAGCVSVPTVGPVEKVEGQQPTCQNCVSVEVEPPAPGDEPRQIVEGFLRSTSNYQPNYSVARQFLTAPAGEKWSPEDGASIYSGTPTAVEDSVSLKGTLIGSLAPDRTFTAHNEPLQLDFGLTKENGEWRIGTPPKGLMVSDFSFSSFYQVYDLYFANSGGTAYNSLVPDPIYLPKLPPANVASVLVKALLNGPSQWLRPAVGTAIPAGTTLTGDSVTITGDGIAAIPLSESVQTLADQDRALLTAQVVYTLKQVVGIKGILFTVNGQAYQVPASDPSSLVVSTTGFSGELDPLPSIAADQLYAVKDGKLEQLDPGAVETRLTPVPGPLGGGDLPIRSLAVSLSNTDVAVVTDRGTSLRRALLSDANAPANPVLDGVGNLIRPQFSRFGELWAVAEKKGRQRVWMSLADRLVQVRAGDLLTGGKIIAFKISPDGTRLAAVRRTSGGGAELGLARIVRTDQKTVTVDGWRVLDTTQSSKPQVTRMADVGWLDATKLLVLGSATKTAALGPIRISVDASQITGDNQANNWDAVQLAVLPRTQTALIVGRDGQVYRQVSNQWQSFAGGISTVAYPG